MAYDIFLSLLVFVSVFTLIFLVLGWFIRRRLQDRSLDNLLSGLPPEYSRIPGDKGLVSGPTGIWLVAGAWSGVSPSSLSARARSYSLKVRQKSGLGLDIQPVLVYPDTAAQTRYQHSVEADTYLVSRRWLLRLVTEERPGIPDFADIARAGEILSAGNQPYA